MHSANLLLTNISNYILLCYISLISPDNVTKSLTIPMFYANHAMCIQILEVCLKPKHRTPTSTGICLCCWPHPIVVARIHWSSQKSSLSCGSCGHWTLSVSCINLIKNKLWTYNINKCKIVPGAGNGGTRPARNPPCLPGMRTNSPPNRIRSLILLDGRC